MRAANRQTSTTEHSHSPMSSQPDPLHPPAPHTILVVGGAGYIGSHMVSELLEQGYQVLTLDDLSTGHRELLPGGEFVKGSLGDASLLDHLFGSRPIDAVMHFAAFSLVGESVQHPLKYYRNNLAMTTALIEAMVRHRVDRFIFSSTAAVYGEPDHVPISEDHPFRPTNPYGVTKATVERMLADCEAAYGLRYVSLRYFNAAGAHVSGKFGERHRPESHLIPLILQVAAGKRENIQVFGTDYETKDGTCIRDYVHVTDLAAAHLLSLDWLLSGGSSQVFNLGNSKGYSVKSVIQAACRVTGKTIPVVEAPRRPGDPAVLVADSTRIRQQLGWKPVFEDLDTIIDTAWRWHRREAGL
jgi:UDP-glucose 4-epimerase